MPGLPAQNFFVDIYSGTALPPHPPRLAGIPAYIVPYGRSTLTTPYYTHKLLLPIGTAIQDDYVNSGFTAFSANSDRVFASGDTTEQYVVILARRVGLPSGYVECLIKRLTNFMPPGGNV